jgi:hypothetical protein
MSYGPRTNTGGGNSPRNSSAGMQVPEEYRGAGERQAFFQNMAQKQDQTVRFTEVPRHHPATQEATIGNNGGSMTGAGYPDATSNNPRNSNPGVSNPGTGNSGNTNPVRNHGFWGTVFGDGSGNQQAGSSPTRNNGGINTGSQPNVTIGGSESGGGRQGGNGSGRMGGSIQNNDNNMQGGSPNRGNWGGGGGGGVFPSGGGMSAPRGGGGGGGGRPR